VRGRGSTVLAARRVALAAFLLLLPAGGPWLAACGGAVQGSIGVKAQRENATGRVVITQVPEGHAGAMAGLEVGDEILAVDGRAVRDMSPTELREALRGDVGSKTVLTVQRDGLLRRVEVRRGPFE
jgi:carboxyl-terminal processing protease